MSYKRSISSLTRAGQTRVTFPAPAGLPTDRKVFVGIGSLYLRRYHKTFGTSWHSRAPRRSQGLNRSGFHRGMTSQILSTSKPSSALRPALVRTDSDTENRGCVLVPLSPHFPECPVVSPFLFTNFAAARTDPPRRERRLVDKRPKRQVSFDETADGHDGLVLQVREEPSLYRASLDYLKRNSWLPLAVLLLCIVVLAAMPSIINFI